MRWITVFLLTCFLWVLCDGSTHAPASEVFAETVPVKVEEAVLAYSQEDLEWLARLVHAEAEGEPLQGKIAVANVVLNRVQSKHFPDTIKQVIFQKVNGHYQFCPVRNGSIYEEPSPEAWEAARLALMGRRVVQEALYFYNPRLATCCWIRTRPVVKVIGNHYFAG